MRRKGTLRRSLTGRTAKLFGHCPKYELFANANAEPYYCRRIETSDASHAKKSIIIRNGWQSTRSRVRFAGWRYHPMPDFAGSAASGRIINCSTNPGPSSRRTAKWADVRHANCRLNLKHGSIRSSIGVRHAGKGTRIISSMIPTIISVQNSEK